MGWIKISIDDCCHVAWKVGETALDVLARLPDLESPDMGCSVLSDAAVAKFERFPSLRRLEVETRHLTDAGLRSLAKLTNLRELVLWTAYGQDAAFTPTAFRQLQDALPYAEVWRH